MTTRNRAVWKVAATLLLVATIPMMGSRVGAGAGAVPPRPEGPCDIYAAAGDPCVAAHSTTRALYGSYNGPLYQVLRQSDGKTLDIGVVSSSATDSGGYANAAAQDTFCANTYCWITTIYDQSPKHNDLKQAPRGGFSGPGMGGFNNIPIADMAPVTVMGHKVYGVFIAPGMGLRQNDPKGTAVDDQAQGQYWVINGQHYNNGCCFDYGNAEIDSRDDDNGTMETTYFGNATGWYRGVPPGPWVMTDQENNLVGCVTSDGTKNCPDLPSVSWRFVTAMAKGEPHHWTSLGGDAQKGKLSVMFDGARVDHTYDPMRKQGAILLGNGGDNSNGSQGTFYEGAMTAAGTFPTDATDQLVQANVVAAKYDVPMLTIAPASAASTPPGLQTFSPGSSQETIVSFANTTGAPVTGLTLSISAPRWTAVVQGASRTVETFAETVKPGDSVAATFKITSGPTAFNGDLVAKATWKAPGGAMRTETVTEKIRSVAPIKINEFRVNAGVSTNPTNSFIELFNAGASEVDLSGWTLTTHATQQAIFSSVKVPAGTKLASHGFYLLGLSTSGLAAQARAGDAIVHVRSVAGLTVGDTIEIDTGAGQESRKIASIGTSAGNITTLFQPLPDGPVMTIPAGATRVPVTSVAGFTVGEKIGIGYGATYPTVAGAMERYEVVTVTAIGKPGAQAFLAADAAAGSTSIKVTSVGSISVGDKIRLDIDSVGHGIETVTVTKVGTQAGRTALGADAAAGATSIRVRGTNGFVVGDEMTVGTPATHEIVTITSIGAPTQPNGPAMVEFTPALAKAHLNREFVVAHGTGLELAAALKFNHAANLPFAAQGTGISFTPATAFAHSSNEPIQPLGTGITLDSPLTKEHAIDAVVRDAAVTVAGYQADPAPNQWFGGPVLSAGAGTIVLRDAAGNVADSLNYGGIVDPWAAEGYHGNSGTGESGCRAPSPGGGRGGGGQGAPLPPNAPHRSAFRFPDGADTDSNCNDFFLQRASNLSAASVIGATNIKVNAVGEIAEGQTVVIDNGPNLETAIVQTVGTAGATTTGAAVMPGATQIPVTAIVGFANNQTITIDSGGGLEEATVASVAGGGRGTSATITLAVPLKSAHPAGVQVSGSGITLTTPLTKAHPVGAQVAGSVPTPGAPNQLERVRK